MNDDSTPTAYPSMPYVPDDITLVIPFYYQIAIPEEANLTARDTRENTNQNDILDDLRSSFEKLINQGLIDGYERKNFGTNIRSHQRRNRKLQWQPLDTVTFEIIEDGELPEYPCENGFTCQVIQSKLYMIYASAMGAIPAVDTFKSQTYSILRTNMHPESPYFVNLVDNPNVSSILYGGDSEIPDDLCLDGNDCDSDGGLSTIEYSVLGISLMFVLCAYPLYLIYIRRYGNKSHPPSPESVGGLKILPIGGSKVMAVFHNQTSNSNPRAQIHNQTITAEWEDWEVTNSSHMEDIDDEEGPVVRSLETDLQSATQNPPIISGYNGNNNTNRLSFNPAEESQGANYPMNMPFPTSPTVQTGQTQPLPTFSKSLSSSASFSFAENTRKLQSVVESGDWESAKLLARSMNNSSIPQNPSRMITSSSEFNSQSQSHSQSNSTEMIPNKQKQENVAAIDQVRSISPLSSMAQSRSESGSSVASMERSRLARYEVDDHGEDSRSDSSGSLSIDEARKAPMQTGNPSSLRTNQVYMPTNPKVDDEKDGDEVASRSSSDNSSQVSERDVVDTENNKPAAAEFKRQIISLLHKLAPDDVNAADAMIAQFEGREYDLLQELQMMQVAKSKEESDSKNHVGTYSAFTSDEEEESDTEQVFADEESRTSDMAEDTILGGADNMGYSLTSRSAPPSQSQNKAVTRHSSSASSSSAEARAAMAQYYLKATNANQRGMLGLDSDDASEQKEGEVLPSFYELTATPTIKPELSSTAPRHDVSSHYSDNSSNRSSALLDDLDSAVARGDWDAVQRKAKSIQSTTTPSKAVRALNSAPSFQRSSSSVGDVSSAPSEDNLNDHARLAQLEQQINLEDWQSIMQSAQMFSEEVGDGQQQQETQRSSRHQPQQQRVSARRGGIIRQSLQGVEPEVKMMLSQSLDDQDRRQDGRNNKTNNAPATVPQTQPHTREGESNLIDASGTNGRRDIVDPLAMEWAISKGLRNLDRRD